VGGAGDVASFVTGFEEMSYGDVSLQVKVGVQFGLFGGAIQQLGTARHHERFLPGVLDLSVVGCFAMTETGHGSDVQALGTTATFLADDDVFVLDTPGPEAWKDYIGNAAAHARWAVVFAQLHTAGADHGVHALLVRIRDDDGTPVPGVQIGDDGHKLGLNGVDNGRLAFEGVRVPRDQLLDRFAAVDADGTYSSPIENPTRRFFTMLGTLVQGRVAVAGAGIGAAKLAATIAVKHGERRTQFAAPGDDAPEVRLLDYAVHQQRLLPRVARTYALHFAQQELVELLHAVATGEVTDEEERRRLETRAAGQKALATWHATDTVQEAREATGGFGYLSENRLGQLKSDTDVFTTFEGANHVLLQLVAKSLLTRYRQDFGSLDLLGTARFVAEQAVDVVVERLQARSLVRSLIDAVDGREGEVSVLDRGWHLQLFEQREEHVLQTLVQRLRRLTAEKGAFAAFNEVQDHVLLAATAHVERTVLDAFVAAIDACDDPAVTAVLDRVCDLYALTVVRDERGWFQEHGFLTGARSKAVLRAVNGLCSDLRPHAEDLVDAFGIPDGLLRAPIALREVGEPYLDARERLVADGVLPEPEVGGRG
jgi:acyl-CoA oxidase